MARLVIVKEKKAQRCEICHQADCLDTETNTCSRCQGLNVDLVKAAATNQVALPMRFNYASPQVVIPNTVAIEDLGDTFTVIYRWFSAKRLGMFLIIGLSQSFNVLGRLYDRPDSILFWPLLCMLLLYLLIILMIVVNKTYITITDDEIIKRSGPISLFSTRTIALDEVDRFDFEKRFRDDVLYLILKNGRKIKLLRNRDDKESMEFIERVLKERIDKKK